MRRWELSGQCRLLRSFDQHSVKTYNLFFTLHGKKGKERQLQISITLDPWDYKSQIRGIRIDSQGSYHLHNYRRPTDQTLLIRLWQPRFQKGHQWGLKYSTKPSITSCDFLPSSHEAYQLVPEECHQY